MRENLTIWLKSFIHKHNGLLLPWYTKNKSSQKKNKMYSLDGSEASMISVISDNLNIITNGKKDDYNTFQEFSAGPGIADLVFSRLNKEVVNKRQSKYFPAVTNYTELETFLRISNMGSGGVSIEELLDFLPHTKSTLLKKVLPSLISSKLIKVNNGRYSTIDTYSHGVQHCVAIEAKVKDWQSGVFQAYRYKEFADDTYLAIYEDHVRPCLANLELFIKLNVGLIGVGSEGLRIYHRPISKSYAKPLNKALAFERMLSFLDDRNKPFVLREPFARV